MPFLQASSYDKANAILCGMCCELAGLPTLLRPVAGQAGYRSRQGKEMFLVSTVAHQAFYEIIITGCFNGGKVTGVYI
jgi:hypothetical protein